jgi:hypothetical protein
MGTSDDDYDRLCDAIEEAWDALDQDKIDNLIKSMPYAQLQSDGFKVEVRLLARLEKTVLVSP